MLLKITFENESGKYYFALDSDKYTVYPDEQEILLQAGLVFQIVSVREEGYLTVIEMRSSEKKIDAY